MIQLLHRHKYALHWIHIVIMYVMLFFFPVAISWFGGSGYFRSVMVAVFSFLGTVQNIGLMHVHFHEFPKGPSWFVSPVVYLHYALGGLNFARGRLAHQLHHAFLGTSQDPDRVGYLGPVSLGQRLRYLLYVGPLRRIFAPVDVELARSSLGCTSMILLTQILLLIVLQGFYLSWALGLIAAHMLGNIREMAEHGGHGHGGHGRLFNVKVSTGTLFLFSGLGFWYHGFHHCRPHIHYLELPLLARRVSGDAKARKGYWHYLLTGS